MYDNDTATAQTEMGEKCNNTARHCIIENKMTDGKNSGISISFDSWKRRDKYNSIQFPYIKLVMFVTETSMTHVLE